MLTNYELKGSLEATFDLDGASEKPQAHYNLRNTALIFIDKYIKI